VAELADQRGGRDISKGNQQILEIYTLYVEMADHVSHRRALANSFFLTLHTGLLGLAIGLAGLYSGKTEIAAAGLAASVFGLPFALVWWLVLNSYRQLNSAKFKVVHELEARLPAAPYDDEWEKAGRGKDPKIYIPLTKVEGWVPIVFAVGYLGAGAFAAVLLGLSLH